MQSGVFGIFDLMKMSHYMEVYLSSGKMDCSYIMGLEDDNNELGGDT